jgi:DNA-binding protein HU-beta
LPLDSDQAVAYNAKGFRAGVRDQAARRSSDASGVREEHVNKQDLVTKIAKDVELSKSAAAAAVDSFIDGITKALKKGDSITFVGFGTFKTSMRKARTARNPQTGASIKVPKRRVARFTAGSALKKAVR